jgi:hypothetical protein
MIKRAFLYGITGLTLEILWTGFCAFVRGDMSMTAHTSLLMLPIYSMVVFLEPLFDMRLSGVPRFIRGLSYLLMIFACEYFSGKLLGILGICPWYYDSTLSIDGVIRADYAPLWFFAGLMYEEIYYKISPN